VSLTVNPADVDPGSYQASIDVLDPSVDPFSFRATVTLQYPNWWLLALASIPVLAVGTFLAAASSARSLFAGGWRAYAKFIVAFGAAGAAFLATYWRDPTWGSDGSQAVTLGGVVIAAYMSSLTALNVQQGKTDEGSPAMRNNADAEGTAKEGELGNRSGELGGNRGGP